MSRAPRLYTARYFADGVLSSGEVAPVRLSIEKPENLGIRLPYGLESAHSLIPEPDLGDEWSVASPRYWRRLDEVGVERIAGELAAISDCYGGLPLALCDYEDVEKPHASYRVIFAKWWKEHTGESVPELTGNGRVLDHKDLHWQARKVTKPRKQDKRWSDDPVFDWPLSDDEIRAWIAARYWQFAKTLWRNPHSYTHAEWGDRRMFVRVILHIIEHGRVERYGKQEYTVYDLDDYFLWSMGAPASATVILNAKYHEPEKQRQQAIEVVGKDPFEERPRA